MTNDIVTRLRDWAVDLYPAPYGACMEQAAEEIERLRALSIELMASIAEMAEKGLLPKITVRMNEAGKALDEAVHGD